MRIAFFALILLYFTSSAQDTIRYKSLVAKKSGEYLKLKYKSPVTNAKSFEFLKKGRWTSIDSFGNVIKIQNFSASKVKRFSHKHGHQIFLDPDYGDTILVRTYNKGRLSNQYAFKPAILEDGNKIFHIFKDFESYTILQYEKKLKGYIDRDFTSIWKASLGNAAMDNDSVYKAFEDSISDPSLLASSAYNTKSRYNYVSNSEFETHPGAITSVMSYTKQVPNWEIASESPDFYISRNEARSGKAFVGFRVFTMQKDIEYVQNRLKQPLKKDSIYCFSAHLKLSPGSKFATNAFGILFAEDAQQINTDQRLTLKPSMRLNNQVLSYKTRWMKVQCAYKAKGGEKWMVLGSFQNHKELELMEVPGKQLESYYYIDDVSLVPLEKQEDCDCNFSDKRSNYEPVIEDSEESIFTNLKKGDKLVLDDIHFDNDKSTLKPSSFSTLYDLLMVLNQKPTMTVELSGHTSSLGNLDHNIRLSKKRADAVKKFLVLNGVSKERIETEGYGPKFPIADDITEAGQLQNRRVEFKVLSE